MVCVWTAFITLINIIFFYPKKQYFLPHLCLSHNKHSHFISSLCFFSPLTLSLSPSLISSLPTYFSLYPPLFYLFSLFLLLSITPSFNKIFFFSPHRSVNGSVTIFVYLSNYLYWISLLVKLFGVCGILNYLKWNLRL